MSKQDSNNEFHFEHEQLERLLLQIKKYEAVGQLTRVIAHDFNNILASIIGFTDLARSRLQGGTDERLQHYLNEIFVAGERARDTVAEIQAIGNDNRRKPKTLTLEDILEKTVNVLAITLPADIEVRTFIPPDIPQINVDQLQLHQIITNLCANSRDAISGAGLLEISLVNKSVDPQQTCVCCRSAFSGHFMQLTISDNGSGIAPELVPRIFEPLYTTKETGQNYGMGLCMVDRMIHQQGGHVSVETQEGVGSRFSLWLPI